MLIENLIAEKLQKRLSLYSSSYHVSLGEQRRIWITLDGKEIFNDFSAQFLHEHDRLWEEVKKRSDQPFPDNLYECYPEWIGKADELDYTILILEQRGIFDADRVYDSLVQYPSFSIEKAMDSEDVIIQAFAMLDKRLGKRRLTQIEISSVMHPLVTQFIYIRREAEGISL